MSALLDLRDGEWELVAALADPDGRRGAPEHYPRRPSGSNRSATRSHSPSRRSRSAPMPVTLGPPRASFHGTTGPIRAGEFGYRPSVIVVRPLHGAAQA